MANPNVLHRGRTIEFDTVKETWRHNDLKFEDKSLTVVKKQIDDFVNSNVRGVAAYMVGVSWGNIKIEKVEITSIDKDERHAWTTRGEGNSKQRSKERVDMLVPITAEAKDAIKVWEIAVKRQAEAAKEAEQAYAQIPRMTVESIRRAGGKA